MKYLIVQTFIYFYTEWKKLNLQNTAASAQRGGQLFSWYFLKFTASRQYAKKLQYIFFPK